MENAAMRADWLNSVANNGAKAMPAMAKAIPSPKVSQKKRTNLALRNIFSLDYRCRKSEIFEYEDEVEKDRSHGHHAELGRGKEPDQDDGGQKVQTELDCLTRADRGKRSNTPFP